MGCPILAVHSEIVDYELNSPFTYLRQIVKSKWLFRNDVQEFDLGPFGGIRKKSAV